MLQNRLAKLREERANGEHGFTLIELLVVVVIIGILIAIAIPLYLNYKKGANDKSSQSDLRNAVAAFEQCNSNNPTVGYPSAVSSTGAITGCTGNTQLNLSNGTALTYFSNQAGSPAAGAYLNYILESKNSNGSGAVYCYASAAGGQVTQANATLVTGYAATCPSP